MNLELDKKIVLITGGSKGIGLACAKTFLSQGAHVLIASRSAENLATAKKLLEKYGETFTYKADLSNPDHAENLAKSVHQNFDKVDILINSAGAAQQAPLSELDMSSWRKAIEAKYFTYMFAIQAFLPKMLERKTGNIVNVIGTGGKFPLPFHIAGGAANAALMLTTCGLAGVSANKNIRINGVNPGYIKTERLEHILQAKSRDSGIELDKVEERLCQDIPMGRMGEAIDVANLVAFLASPRSSYITGVNVPIDGGLFRAI